MRRWLSWWCDLQDLWILALHTPCSQPTRSGRHTSTCLIIVYQACCICLIMNQPLFFFQHCLCKTAFGINNIASLFIYRLIDLPFLFISGESCYIFTHTKGKGAGSKEWFKMGGVCETEVRSVYKSQAFGSCTRSSPPFFFSPSLILEHFSFLTITTTTTASQTSNSGHHHHLDTQQWSNSNIRHAMLFLLSYMNCSTLSTSVSFSYAH